MYMNMNEKCLNLLQLRICCYKEPGKYSITISVPPLDTKNEKSFVSPVISLRCVGGGANNLHMTGA